MEEDKRFSSIYNRFRNLSNEEIKRIIDNIDLICLDTFNYDEKNKTYCPIAIAMNLHETIDNPSDHKIYNEISKRFMPVNILKGTDGIFYRGNRKEDLLKICNDILNNRK